MTQTPLLPSWLSRLYVVLFALLPWSFEFSFGSWNLQLPAEPLITVMGIGLGWYVWKNPGAIRRAFANNFILQISAIWICWLGLSALFSTMPVVSWKYWVVETGHWWVFAVAVVLFPSIWQRTFSVFAVSMGGVVVYTLIHHSFYHFRADQALLAPMPFFPGNTLYAAVLALVLFLLFNPTPDPSPEGRGVSARTAPYGAPPLPSGEGSGVGLNSEKKLLLILFFTGLIFSFCRAAWISVLIAGTLGFALVFRKKWRWFAFAGVLLVITGITLREQIFDQIAKDVSMMERINRYACARRMVSDRPWTGFGPGTFQFKYIPYQHPEEMTRISAKNPVTECSPHTYGRGGGAHSEFMQALAETGWPGLLFWTILVMAAIYRGLKVYFLDKNTDNQRLALALSLALLTFLLHGTVNNMLHDGRMAALVWGMIAMLSRFHKSKLIP